MLALRLNLSRLNWQIHDIINTDKLGFISTTSSESYPKSRDLTRKKPEVGMFTTTVTLDYYRT
jgi:hypothetical protein